MRRAVVFGSGGKLGPIWVKTLTDAGYAVLDYDYPQWDARRSLIWTAPAPDVVLYNAAIDHPPGESVNFFTDCDDIVDVNLLGAVRVFNAVMPKMVENGGGVFIVVGSIQGFVGADWRNYPPGFEKPVGYNLSKASLPQLVRSVTVLYGPKNIRAVCMAFAAVDTGKLSQEFLEKYLRCVPLGRPVSAESLRTTLLYAIQCPDLTGQTVLVDGGYTAW